MSKHQPSTATSKAPAECACCDEVFEAYGNLCDPCWRSGCSKFDDFDCRRGER